jgi:cell division ATPase FtsA
MKIHKPYLFIEIQDKQFNFLVVEYNEEFEYKVLDFSTINSEGIKDGKIIDAALSTSIIQKNLNQIENKINYNFKFASIINSQSNLSCINVSIFKKLG